MPTTASARLAALTRHRGPNDPATLAAAADHKAERLRAWITDALTSAPPLTDGQRADLAGLLLAPPPARRRHAR